MGGESNPRPSPAAGAAPRDRRWRAHRERVPERAGLRRHAGRSLRWIWQRADGLPTLPRSIPARKNRARIFSPRATRPDAAVIRRHFFDLGARTYSTRFVAVLLRWHRGVSFANRCLNPLL